MNYELDDTIAAIATAPGDGGLCVVRISGKTSLEVADRIFRGKDRPSRCKTHTIHYGRVVEPDTEAVIDEVLLSVLRAPRTFTCEDTVEISGHGGVQPGRRILKAVLLGGARLAGPGEFTRRAFLNGRIDLTQAEAVADLIRARTEAMARAAVRQLSGRFSGTVAALRERTLQTLALVEVGLDFVEEDIETFRPDFLGAMVDGIVNDLEQLTKESRRARYFRDGVRLAVVGLPNVGKSSILNKLIGEDRVIVDASPGTTRDTIEATVDLAGIPVTLIDTAGVRSDPGAVEAKGIARTWEEINRADLFLWILDVSQPFTESCRAISDRLPVARTLTVFNKCDLEDALSFSWEPIEDGSEPILVSAATGEGWQALETALADRLTGSLHHAEPDFCLNVRHLQHLEEALEHTRAAVWAIRSPDCHEIAAVELRCAFTSLGDILGLEVGEDVLDRIFSSFCIGK